MVLGHQAFSEQLLKLGEAVLKKKRHRSYRATQESHAHAQSDARNLLKKGIAAAGLSFEMLRELPGSDVRKVAIASLIWERTTVSMKWLAENLSMRSAANASQQIRRHRKEPRKLPKALNQWIIQSRNVA